MARDWPATDMGPLIALIADPRHTGRRARAPRKLSDEQARAILELRLPRLTALGRDEIEDELDKLADEIEDYLDILRSRGAHPGDHQGRADGDPRRVRHAAPHRDSSRPTATSRTRT